MDDYMFHQHVKTCRNVTEEKSCLEIFNYSVRSARRSEICAIR